MPQLDVYILISQIQLIFFFFIGYYLFIYRVLPRLFVFLAVSNEFIIYKYYKYEFNVDTLINISSSRNRTKLFSLILESHLNKASKSDLCMYLDI